MILDRVSRGGIVHQLKPLFECSDAGLELLNYDFEVICSSYGLYSGGVYLHRVKSLSVTTVCSS